MENKNIINQNNGKNLKALVNNVPSPEANPPPSMPVANPEAFLETKFSK